MSQNSTTTNQYDPAQQLGFPIPIGNLQYAGASSGDVIAFNGTDVVWEQAGSLIQEVLVTSPELLNMFTSPVILIPAPGVGKFIVVDKIIMKYDFNSQAYTQPGFTNVVMNGNNIVQFGTSLNSGSSFIKQGTPTSVTLTENSPLELTNTTGNLTNGDGTVILYIYYSTNTF